MKTEFTRLFRLAAMVALVLALAAPTFAQQRVVANDAYQLGYYTGEPHPSSLGIINTGQTGSPMSKDQGTICADVYIFDANQEMASCCACKLTANALIGVGGDGLPLTGIIPSSGVVKVVADAGCDETSIATPVNGGLRSFLINLDETDPLGLPHREILLETAPLTSQEQQFLGNACAFVQYLGSGRGHCSCFPGGLGLIWKAG